MDSISSKEIGKNDHDNNASKVIILERNYQDMCCVPQSFSQPQQQYQNSASPTKIPELTLTEPIQIETNQSIEQWLSRLNDVCPFEKGSQIDTKNVFIPENKNNKKKDDNQLNSIDENAPNNNNNELIQYLSLNENKKSSRLLSPKKNRLLSNSLPSLFPSTIVPGEGVLDSVYTVSGFTDKTIQSQSEKNIIQQLTVVNHQNKKLHLNKNENKKNKSLIFITKK